MATGIFSPYALYWVGGFALIYTVARLLVARHPRFQLLSDIQKSVLIKLIAIGSFSLAYAFVQFVVV